jgi:hypothetical protein
VAPRFSGPVQTETGVQPALCAIGTGYTARGYSVRGTALTTHPHVATRLKTEKAIHTTTSPLGYYGLFYGDLYGYLFTTGKLYIHS